jgi:methionine sulfoxide reductase catalytic subunit
MHYRSGAYRLNRRLWEIPVNTATPEDFFRERRRTIKTVGALGLGLVTGAVFGCGPAQDAAKIGAQEHPPGAEMYPASRDSRFALDRPITDEIYAASYNNFYEFSTSKGSVYKKASRLRTFPWQVAVGGLVSRSRVFEIDELVRAKSRSSSGITAFAAWRHGRWPSRGPGFRCMLS